MRFLLDESAEYRIATSLRELGHDVTTIAEDYPAIADSDVLAIAHQERRILITNDRGFGELVVRDKQGHSGVILLRLPSGDTDAKIAAIERLLHTHGDRLAEFVVIDGRGVRVRTLAPEP